MEANEMLTNVNKTIYIYIYIFFFIKNNNLLNMSYINYSKL